MAFPTISNCMKNPRTILITGASSGIGEALAKEFAHPGIFLALSGRNRQRLEKVAEICRAQGADVSADIVDVADRDAMRKWIERIEEDHPLDLVIANAGIAGDSGGRGFALNESSTRDIFAINMAGVLNTLFPAIEPMRRRKRGQLALVSSIAGFRGLPSAPAYSASKVMVKAYGEALHGVLREDGIGVTVICPGFVESRITERNEFPMPMIWKAAKAASVIRRGLAKGKILIAFPWPLIAIMRALDFLPTSWAIKFLSRLPRKG